jgi:SAM-dependent methyltransferase
VPGYATDLAAIHDAGFLALAEAGTDDALRLLRSSGLDSGLVVELGCGSGATARRLTDAGYDVLAYDQSAAMVDLARTRAPDADVRKGSFLKARIPSGTVAVLAIGEVLGYRFDLRRPANLLEGVIDRVAGGLIPGGLLLFDLATPGRVPGGRMQSWFAAGDWAVLVDATEDRDALMLSRDITTFRHDDAGTYRRSHEVHHLRLYEPGHVLAALRSRGFSARVRRAYEGTQPLGAGHRVFVARRRPTEQETPSPKEAR